MTPAGDDLGIIATLATSSVELAKYDSEKLAKIGLPESSPVAPVIVNVTFMGSACTGIVEKDKINEKNNNKLILLRDFNFNFFIGIVFTKSPIE